VIKVGSVVKLIKPPTGFRDMIDCLAVVERIKKSYKLHDILLYNIRCFEIKTCDFHIELTVYSHCVSEVS